MSDVKPLSWCFFLEDKRLKIAAVLDLVLAFKLTLSTPESLHLQSVRMAASCGTRPCSSWMWVLPFELIANLKAAPEIKAADGMGLS
jgi:hypothetical protein